MTRASLSTPARHPIADWAVTLVLFLFGTTTLVQAYVVPSGSMEGTLRVGDHLLVDKLSYAPPGAGAHLLPYRDVHRGDIVVFRYPRDISETYVKRCIGLPGDRVRMENKQLYVNGVRQNESYVRHIDPETDPARDTFAELTVPDGHYFMLGDNRDNSADSRFWGFVPRANIVGRPLIVYWSYDAPEERLRQAIPSLEHIVDVATHFFTRTRWERTLHVVR
jgi:signal peptidase I